MCKPNEALLILSALLCLISKPKTNSVHDGKGGSRFQCRGRFWVQRILGVLVVVVVSLARIPSTAARCSTTATNTKSEGSRQQAVLTQRWLHHGDIHWNVSNSSGFKKQHPGFVRHSLSHWIPWVTVLLFLLGLWKICCRNDSFYSRQGRRRQYETVGNAPPLFSSNNERDENDDNNMHHYSSSGTTTSRPPAFNPEYRPALT